MLGRTTSNKVATFLCLSSILKLCVTKIILCNILLVMVTFMQFQSDTVASVIEILEALELSLSFISVRIFWDLLDKFMLVY
jgi:hypothetical protein